MQFHGVLRSWYGHFHNTEDILHSVELCGRYYRGRGACDPVGRSDVLRQSNHVGEAEDLCARPSRSGQQGSNWSFWAVIDD